MKHYLHDGKGSAPDIPVVAGFVAGGRVRPPRAGTGDLPLTDQVLLINLPEDEGVGARQTMPSQPLPEAQQF